MSFFIYLNRTFFLSVFLSFCLSVCLSVCLSLSLLLVVPFSSAVSPQFFFVTKKRFVARGIFFVLAVGEESVLDPVSHTNAAGLLAATLA